MGKFRALWRLMVRPSVSGRISGVHATLALTSSQKNLIGVRPILGWYLDWKCCFIQCVVVRHQDQLNSTRKGVTRLIYTGRVRDITLQLSLRPWTIHPSAVVSHKARTCFPPSQDGIFNSYGSGATHRMVFSYGRMEGQTCQKAP
jgi:hypothetical protein